ncbi:alpha-1,3/1,6-mannosyltransferase ALG2 [Bos indicus]|uniref:Alpha-1,3/1,6-mannosyltransferase ALG2 n=3 Tax=Bos TaxID=9903 RepID=A4FUG6_BOVIN|nr:alpha-1,3/1,6-mannosyltransferase ALG2 [Bos taurus]XP_027405557.1 alpha-1,3/1,6-mannosyltransferase ALG2 [Bos indicus x Bos taurus]AAI14871.1 ALG2 protein [Bos taurus]DAA26758.1 TPA: alpha-1,3-mannosyltransferase ALG2 [Bos taurus]
MAEKPGQDADSDPKPTVLFLHPDLGVGGAERLVLDAALALQARGCSVKIWTAHYDPGHCFAESRELSVHCAGDWLPRSLGWGGRGAAVCAYVRMIFLALYVLFLGDEEFDVVVCDQVSACIPVFKLARRRKKILFYCHFPDLLLTRRDSFIKRLYRAPIDWVEEYTTGMADCILVNSRFTAAIFKETFKSLSHIDPAVLYPSLNIVSFDSAIPEKLDDIVPQGKKFIFLSINRYERKKNLTLAVEALVKLRGRLTSQDWDKVHLIIAGGYDERVLENVQHYQELKQVVQQSDLGQYVTFLRSCSDKQKISLLRGCTCVLYTPSNEHFGIVPLEAMYMQCPVIAVNSGGPLESVVHSVTGFLCDPDPEHFSEAIEKFIHEPSLKATMGLAGRNRVKEKFSPEAFTEQLYQYVTKLLV